MSSENVGHFVLAWMCLHLHDGELIWRTMHLYISLSKTKNKTAWGNVPSKKPIYSTLYMQN